MIKERLGIVKKLLKNIIGNFVEKLVAIAMSYMSSKSFKKLGRKVYSEKIKHRFFHCGKNFKMDPYSTIIGERFIRIGDDFGILGRSRIEAIGKYLDVTYNPKLSFGDKVRVGTDFHVSCINEIIIGNNVLIASKVFITDHSHGDLGRKDCDIPPGSRVLISKGPVIIEDNVWIGEGVVILPKVTIGKNSVIGANSVVNKSCPPNSVIAGVPAKIIRVI